MRPFIEIVLSRSKSIESKEIYANFMKWGKNQVIFFSSTILVGKQWMLKNKIDCRNFRFQSNTAELKYQLLLPIYEIDLRLRFPNDFS